MALHSATLCDQLCSRRDVDVVGIDDVDVDVDDVVAVAHEQLASSELRTLSLDRPSCSIDCAFRSSQLSQLSRISHFAHFTKCEKV